MSIYNYLRSLLCCPACGRQSEIDVEFRFGIRDLRTYRIGDKLVWEGKGVRTPSGRPPHGDFEDVGYAECPWCGTDFWVRISVKNDVLTSAEVDPSLEGYLR